MDKPNYIAISEIVDETPFVKTFYFNFDLKSKPGQFVMLWLPGVDQKPFSVSYDDGKKFGLTVFKRGPLTEKLFSLNVGDRVGISGPYGTSFSVKPNTHYIMVAGGYGAAPLAFLAETLCRHDNVKIDFYVGGRSAEHILFEKRLSSLPNLTLHIATDDGSKGHKGFVSDLLPVILSERLPASGGKNPLICTCGPELMEKKVLAICNEHNLNCELSIERHMKCGIGVCGQCAVDPVGVGMCVKGPVVNRELANQITEFGVYHRDKSGTKIYY